MNDTEEIIEDAEVSADEKYKLHIDNFDGPLDLLWELIKRSKINIIDVSISQITEQYIAYLKLMEKMNIGVATEFINMASDLLYYKSKALLPTGEIDEDFFVPPLPPELIAKLLEFKKYQQSSEKLKDLYQTHSDCYSREETAQVETIDENGEYLSMSLFDLLNAFVDVIGSTAKIDDKEIIFDEILVSDRINFIIARLRNKEKILFTELFKKNPIVQEVVATFLAMLELTKMQKIKIMQGATFEKIFLTRNFEKDAELSYDSSAYEIKYGD